MKFRLNENNTKLILTESTSEEYNQLQLYIDRYVHNWRFKVKRSMGHWNGKTNLFKDGFIDFGLWREVQNCCKKYGYPFIIQNQEKFPIDKDIKLEDVDSFCKEFYKDHKNPSNLEEPFTPHDHQITSIYKILKFKYGLIEVATAGGKSLIFSTMLFYYLTKINPSPIGVK